MKLGNISQTIVPVPNFFVDRKNRTIETFNIYPKTTINNISNTQLKKIVKLNLNSIVIYQFWPRQYSALALAFLVSIN